MTKPTLCLLNPDDDYRPDVDEWKGQLATLTQQFEAKGVNVATARWSDDADLTQYDLTIPLMAWGYHRKLDRWLALLDRWEMLGVRMINPLPVLRWNSDKSYLLDFERRGIAIIPSQISLSLADGDLTAARIAFGTNRLVIKPVSSAGSDGTYLLGVTDGVPQDVMGRRMLIQPVMDAIMTEGELSLFMLGGQFSHAIVKRPKSGDFRVQPQFGGCFEALDPPPAARALADTALATSGPDIAYARVDMVADGQGGYALMEIELIEPFLFLERAPDDGAGFVDMVLGQMGITTLN